MSNLRLDGSPISSGYTITIYKFEPFSYTFTPPDQTGSTGYLDVLSTSTLVTALVSETSTTSVQFQSPGYLPWDPFTRGYTGATSSNEQIVIGWGTTFVDGNLVIQQSYTINVIIRPGRFVLPTLTNPSYTLYVNESITSTFGEPIRFQAPGNLAITRPFTTPALPPGLSFVAVGSSPSLSWDLTGTPLTGIPSTSYTVYGRGASNTSFVISKTISIAVGAERIVFNASPSSNVSMTVGTAISDTTITARYPNSFASNLSYAWSFLPAGLQFVDVSSNAVTSPFRPTDTGSTMILRGTPTEPAAQLYRSLGVSNVVTNVVATRQTSPNITSTLPLSLSFGPTVLFDPIVIPQLYVSAPIDPISIPIRANTYFPSSSGMASITAPSLPAGLSLVHTPGSSVAYLTGTPTTAVSNSFAFTATNSNAISQTSNVTISVISDVITFTPSEDVCYNFVISRPLNEGLTGYYPSNITYTASAASGGNVVISATGFAGTGISVDISGSTLSLSGIPDTVTGFTTAVITASNSATGVVSNINLDFEVLTDTITLTRPSGSYIPNPQFIFVQNKPITPFQFAATTLSGRPVINWSTSTIAFPFPTGISISSTGLMTGTPSGSSNFISANVIASTGYVSQTNLISFRVIEDEILITLLDDPTIVSEQFSNIEYRAVSYSGTELTAAIGNIEPLQNTPITFSISGNFISGNLGTATGILPQYRVSLDASIGSVIAQEPLNLTVSNANTQVRFLLNTILTNDLGGPPGNELFTGEFYLHRNRGISLTFSSDSKTLFPISNWPLILAFDDSVEPFGYIADIAHSSNTSILVAGTKMFRSTEGGSNWSAIPSTDISSIPGIVGYYELGFEPLLTPGPVLTTIASDGNSNWLALGVGYDSTLGGTQRTILRTSSNDGQTWVDVSLTSTFVPRDRNNRLFYNNGRYFLALSNGTNSTYRADISDLSTWTGSGGGMPVFNNIAYTFAFSNNFVLCGGEGGGTVRPMRVSYDNGTNWSDVSGFSILNTITSISRTGSNWFATNPGTIYFSSNAPSFSQVALSFSAQYDGSEFDGYTFNIYNYQTSNVQVTSYAYDGTSPVSSGFTDIATGSQLKRVTSILVDNGPVTATLGSYAATSGNILEFTQPTIGDYSFLQFVGANIRVVARIPPPVIGPPPTPQFIYYWATGLPQGLSLILDTSGISADISGIPTLYNSSYNQIRLFARTTVVPYLGNTTVSYRVLSPFVLKPQTSAAGYTAYLRQYVEVNAAQNARDSVVLPVEERPIGKFTSPGIPDVVTPSNCPC